MFLWAQVYNVQDLELCLDIICHERSFFSVKIMFFRSLEVFKFKLYYLYDLGQQLVTVHNN